MILAIDYGRARIGLAIADPATQMPQPLGTLERINRKIAELQAQQPNALELNESAEKRKK